MKVYRTWTLEKGGGVHLAAHIKLDPWPDLHEGEDMNMYLDEILDQVLPDLKIPTSRDGWSLAKDVETGELFIMGPVIAEYPKTWPLMGGK